MLPTPAGPNGHFQRWKLWWLCCYLYRLAYKRIKIKLFMSYVEPYLINAFSFKWCGCPKHNGIFGLYWLKKIKSLKTRFYRVLSMCHAKWITGVRGGVGILRSYLYIVGPFQTHSLTNTTGCKAYMIGSDMIIRSSPCAILVFLNTQNIKGSSGFLTSKD